MAAINANSEQYAKEVAAPKQMKHSYEANSPVRVMYGKYTVVGTTFEAGSTIKFFTMPHGARFIGGYFLNDGCGIGATVKLGWVGDDAALIAAGLSVQNVGVTFLPAVATKAAVMTDVGGKVCLLTSAGATFTAGAVIEVVIKYVLTE